jgi:hypothetical protein
MIGIGRDYRIMEKDTYTIADSFSLKMVVSMKELQRIREATREYWDVYSANF